MRETAMKTSLVRFLILIIAGTVVTGASAAESANSIDIGLGGLNPLPHCNVYVSMIDYEHQITPTTTFQVQGSLIHYKYDDGHYLDQGRLKGMDVGARYYPASGMRGFFWGGTIGYWNEDRTFTQYQNTPNQWQGKGNNNAFRLNIDIGDRIQIQGTNVSIMPVVSLGKFFFPSSCEVTAPAAQIGNPCSRRPEANYFIFAGVSAGIVF